MRWLVGIAMLSAILSVISVRVVGQFFELVGALKVLLFSTVWTAVTTTAGMRSVKSTARKLRTGNAKVLDALKGDK